MSTKTARVVHEETLVCCNNKRCPTAQLLDDGSVILTDDDPAAGSVGKIVLRPEVMDRLIELRAQHKG